MPAELRFRLHLLVIACVLLVGLLAVRLYWLQIRQGHRYDRQSVRYSVDTVPIPTVRGRILDVRGRPLAINEPRFSVTLVPGDVRNLVPTVESLADLLGVPRNRLLKVVRGGLKHSALEPVTLLDGLTMEQVARLAEIEREIPGLELQARPMRRYPFGAAGSHFMGYVGEISEVELAGPLGLKYKPGDYLGKVGLEKRFDMELRGAKGVRYLRIDAAGRIIESSVGSPPTPGHNLILTVDMAFQRAVEDVLQEGLDRIERTQGERTGGAIVVLDARTGEVLALASLPHYDPNLFASVLPEKEYQALLSDKAFPLLNRTIHAAYPPASTFKMVTAAAALQEGLCSQWSSFHCSGSYTLADQTFNCFVTSGHGAIDFVGSLAQSCDTVYYELGNALGIERLNRYSAAFGVGQPTGLDLPDEAAGTLPDDAWKRRHLNEPWFGGDTINMSIGQGYLGVTPLQMSVMTAAVANGGAVLRPYMVKLVTDHNQAVVRGVGPKELRRLPISPDNLAAIRAGMEAAVESGTAKGVWTESVRYAGKTGTAENAPTPDNPQGRNHTWFTGYAPMEAPEIVVTVFLEKSGGLGGRLAAPLARDVFELYFGEFRAVRPPP